MKNNKLITYEPKPRTYLQKVKASWDQDGMLYRFYKWLAKLQRRKKENER